MLDKFLDDDAVKEIVRTQRESFVSVSEAAQAISSMAEYGISSHEIPQNPYG